MRQFNLYCVLDEPLQSYVKFSIAAMGPLGLVYVDQAINAQTRVAIAQDLVDKAAVPMVMTVATDSGDKHTARICTRAGVFILPQDARQVFGEAHPFLPDICKDMIDLCHHPYSGDFILSGWCRDADALSFRIENGAHAGPGINETHAFALLPRDLPISSNGRGYLRFRNLYQAGMNFVGRAVSSEAIEARSVTPQQRKFFRIMTYNVHSCIGMDGHFSTQRIARVIAMFDPDVVALQEIDLNRPGSLNVDQALALADALNMNLEFHPVRQFEIGELGNAILSKHPMRLINTGPLSSKAKSRRPKIKSLDQSRGVMEVEINYRGLPLAIVNTHLGLTSEERKYQVSDLLGPPRFTADKRPTILCGDFNATHKQQAWREISKVMNDVETLWQGKRRKKTFPARLPTLRIDHIFVAKHIRVKAVMVPSNHLIRLASDHLPLLADLQLDGLRASHRQQ